jgi:hypothetical protein
MENAKPFRLYEIFLEAAAEASLTNVIFEIHRRDKHLIFFETLIVSFYLLFTISVLKKLPYPLSFFREELIYISLGFLVISVLSYAALLRYSYKLLKRRLLGENLKGFEHFFRENLQDIRYLLFKKRLEELLRREGLSLSEELLVRVSEVFEEDLAIELEKRNWLFQHPALTTALAALLAILGGMASIQSFWKGWFLPLFVAADILFIGATLFVLDIFRPTWVKLLEAKRFLNWLLLEIKPK